MNNSANEALKFSNIHAFILRRLPGGVAKDIFLKDIIDYNTRRKSKNVCDLNFEKKFI